MRSSIIVARIALADYLHEVRLSVVAIAGLTAVLAPLLVLFGLKHGIVSSLLEDLKSDPLARQIQPLGQGAYDQGWLESLASREEVAFLLPTTRFLSATLRLRNADDRSLRPMDVEMWPTAAGDPLWAGKEPQDQGHIVEAVISAPLARRLRLAEGDAAAGQLGRVVAGDRQSEHLSVRVLGILEPHLEQRDVMLVPLSFLEDSEAYREGMAVPARGWAGQGAPLPPAARTYASFRLYARDLEDVAVLRDHLEAQEVKTTTAAARIDTVLKLNHGLLVLFAIISTLAAGGYAVSMMLNLIATVARKQRDLSVLKLLGFPGHSVAFFPVVQGVTTAIFGAGAALAVYAGVAPLVNRLFAGAMQPGLVICALEPWHIAVAVAATLVVSLATSTVSGVRAARILPAEGLRNE